MEPTRELATIDQATGEVLAPVTGDTFGMVRAPAETLAQAAEAARLLVGIISKKEKPVKFNNEIYLEFEDWQTVGAFFGITAGVDRTEAVTIGDAHGFVAHAVARRADGQVVSSAEAMCMNDEDKWSMRPKYEWRGKWPNKEKVKVGEEPVPHFARRSMAQTRACSKALRNVLAWVVVMAGYKPTPAEEMNIAQDAPRAEPPPAPAGQIFEVTGKVEHFAAMAKGRDGKPYRSIRYVWGMGSGEKFSTFDAELGERAQDAHTAGEVVTCRGSAEARFGAHEATQVEVPG